MSTAGHPQVGNKKICYDELLRQIKNEHQAKARVFIPQLCYALQSEDPLLRNEDITERIKRDLISIWSRTTIYENIPNEFKHEQKQKAARMSHKNVIEKSATPPEQKVLQESSGGTTVFEPKPYKPQEADSLNKSGQEIEKRNQEVKLLDEAQIEQEKEELKKQVGELNLLLRQRSIMFHSKKFIKELRACIRILQSLF